MCTNVKVTARKWAVVLFLYGAGYLLLFGSFLYSEHRAELKRHWITHYLQGPISAPRTAAFFFIAGLSCIGIGYAILLRRALSGDATVVSLGKTRMFVMSLILLFVMLPPFLSSDVFNYYQQGWVVAEKGASPYVTPPAAFDDYPGKEVAWGGNEGVRSPYGAIWTHIERLTVEASRGSLWVGIVLFKLYGAIAGATIVLLASAIGKQLEPGRGSWVVVAVGANPLLLIEGPGMGHNDIIALAVVFLGVWLQLGALNKRWVGLTVLGVASLIKVTVAPAIFVTVHWLLRIRQTYGALVVTLVRGFIPSVLVLTIAGAQFVSQVRDIPLLFGFANVNLGYEIGLTPVNFVTKILVDNFSLAGTQVSASVVKTIVLAVSLSLGGGASLWLLSRARTWVSCMGTLGPIYLIATVVVSYWRPWYVLWPLSLAALGPWSRWTAIIVIYSLLAVSTYVITHSSGISTV